MIERMAQWLGMPQLASENGLQVDELIVLVHWLMLILFIGWLAYFGYAVWRFSSKRNPKADYEGVKGHASNYIELGVVLAEAFLLCVIAIPVWAKAVDHFPDAKNSTVIYIQAQQYAWNVRYPGADPNDPHGKDDFQLLNDIHVPVGKPVIVYVSSKDVIHSFKVVAMRVCQDASPGLRIPCWFTPTKIGRYQVNCAQLCGPGHSGMTGGFLTVESQDDYNKWLTAQEEKVATSSPGGKNPFE